MKIVHPAWAVPVLVATATSSGQVTLVEIGRYESGIFNDSAAEIVAYDAGSQRLFVTNDAEDVVDVLDLSIPDDPEFLFSIDISPWGDDPTSVTAFDGIVAVAVKADPRTAPGAAVFFDVDGNPLSAVKVGALPDMITVTPNRRYVLTADEGEPNDSYSVDPPGSVSIIDLAAGVDRLTQDDVKTVGFASHTLSMLSGVRIFGRNATVAQDLEPEYIAVDGDSLIAYVTLQENNAIAAINIPKGRVRWIRGLGTKNHGGVNAGLDASNEDGVINIRRWKVHGMYQPDAIGAYEWNGRTYLVTANEGDARDYPGFSEEVRVKDLRLNPAVFTNPRIQDDDRLGQLKTTTVEGDRNGDGLYERIHSYGTRSFSIWSRSGKLRYDSGDEIEQVTAALLPDDFNSADDENDSFDDRSDDKGPEPEALALGEVAGRVYAFVGLERLGGIMVYDVTSPYKVEFIEYWTNRDFGGSADAGTAGDLGPEGMVFIPAADSPSGVPLLVVANEVSGTTTVLEVRE